MMTGLSCMFVEVSMAWGMGMCRRACSARHGHFGLAVADLVLAHLFPEHLAADAQVLGRVLALPVVGVERRDDAVALVHVPVAAVGQQGLGGAGVRREGGGRQGLGVLQDALRGAVGVPVARLAGGHADALGQVAQLAHIADRKSTRLNSSHLVISYAVFC